LIHALDRCVKAIEQAAVQSRGRRDPGAPSSHPLGREVDGEVGLVPGLPEADARQGLAGMQRIREVTAIAARGCRGKRRVLRRVGAPGAWRNSRGAVSTLSPPGGTVQSRDDLETAGGKGPGLSIDTRPVVCA